jgi:hypothetical protein
VSDWRHVCTADRTHGSGATTKERSRVDYLRAMELWWTELDQADRERVHDYARRIRDTRRGLKLAGGRVPKV